MTTRASSFYDDVDAYASAGVAAIGVVRHKIADIGAPAARARLDDHGLHASSLGITGFFAVATGAERTSRLDDARRAIEEAAELGAPVLAVVVGPSREVGYEHAVEATRDALSSLRDDARGAGIRLAIEPLHPMFAAELSFVCTLPDALDLVAPLDGRTFGIVFDTFHLSWSPRLPAELAHAKDRVALVHLADWPTELRSRDHRAVPGAGTIEWAPLLAILGDVAAAAAFEFEVIGDEGRGDRELLAACRTAYAELPWELA